MTDEETMKRVMKWVDHLGMTPNKLKNYYRMLDFLKDIVITGECDIDEAADLLIEIEGKNSE